MWVLRKEDLEEARRIMQEMYEENERKVGESWTCPECGETSPALNEMCWNCCADSEDFEDVEEESIAGNETPSPIKDEFPRSTEKGSWVWVCILTLSAFGLIAVLIQGIALLMKP